MCIETTRIFDSCIFKEVQRKTFEIPNSIESQDIECEVTEVKCSILDITNTKQNLVAVKLRIKVFLSFKSKCFSHAFKREMYFDKTITLVVPEDADICCDITNATCECLKLCNESCTHKIHCTVKLTGVVKSKKNVQIEVPYLGNCEPQSCSPLCSDLMSSNTSK